MRSFGTRGRVYPDKHYFVPRTEEIADYNQRIIEGRYIVLFAPRQTGKTTFFRSAIEKLTSDEPNYFPIQLNFEALKNLNPSDFYIALHQRIYSEIENVLHKRGHRLHEELNTFCEETEFTNHLSMLKFF